MFLFSGKGGDVYIVGFSDRGYFFVTDPTECLPLIWGRNRFNFRNAVVFSVFYNTRRWTKSKPPVILSLSVGFEGRSFHFSCLQCVQQSPLISSSLISHSKEYFVKITNYKVIIALFCLVPYDLLPLKSNCSQQHPVLKHCLPRITSISVIQEIKSL